LFISHEPSYQIRVKYPFFSGNKAEGKEQTGALVRTEERKDFKPKGGYQGGFGITHLEHMQVSDITAPLCLDWYSKKSFSLTLASILENL
jgi:hypothetical protein